MCGPWRCPGALSARSKGYRSMVRVAIGSAIHHFFPFHPRPVAIDTAFTTGLCQGGFGKIIDGQYTPEVSAHLAATALSASMAKLLGVEPQSTRNNLFHKDVASIFVRTKNSLGSTSTASTSCSTMSTIKLCKMSKDL